MHEPRKYVNSFFGTIRSTSLVSILNSRHNLGASLTGLQRPGQFQNIDGPSVGEPQIAKSSTYNHLSRHLDQ